MFDYFIGRRFRNKCKHAIKRIATRIADVRRRKQATLWFFRNVVANLIANERDVDAFGRIQGLIAETNHASCYDILQHYCEYISIQLPTLKKQR